MASGCFLQGIGSAARHQLSNVPTEQLVVLDLVHPAPAPVC